VTGRARPCTDVAIAFERQLQASASQRSLPEGLCLIVFQFGQVSTLVSNSARIFALFEAGLIMTKRAEVDCIGFSNVMSHTKDLLPAIARIGSQVLVKCENFYKEGTVVAIKSPTVALIVFRDDEAEELHEVKRERMTLMRGD
jgi:DNA phosphorothioation-dependent restriction protein DptG